MAPRQRAAALDPVGFILFGERSLRAMNEFVAHCHAERNHQGISKRRRPSPSTARSTRSATTSRADSSRRSGRPPRLAPYIHQRHLTTYHRCPVSNRDTPRLFHLTIDTKNNFPPIGEMRRRRGQIS
jgi:hypothetical protein